MTRTLRTAAAITAAFLLQTTACRKEPPAESTYGSTDTIRTGTTSSTATSAPVAEPGGTTGTQQTTAATVSAPLPTDTTASTRTK